MNGTTGPTAYPGRDRRRRRQAAFRHDRDGDADFTAYGRLKTNTRGVAPANITTTLNTWMSQMCTTIKQNGIIIYTILFNNNTAATQTLFRNCASTPANYFLSPTGTDLQNAFKQIGRELSVLRLSQ